MSISMNNISKQICKKMPGDILAIILQYDGRWIKDSNGKWISIFHMSDERYWMLDNMIRWKQFTFYFYPDSGRRSYKNADRIGFIFPIVYDNYIINDNLRYIHINKIIVYDKEIEPSTNEMKIKSKFNIVRTFTSKLSCHLDSSDSYCSDDNEDEHKCGVYQE